MTKDLARLFSSFSDETRVKILIELLSGEMTVGEVAANCKLTLSNTSHQLKSLRMNNLVKSRREGKYIYYSLDDDHVRLIIELGIEHLQENK